ncbi:MAG: tetratricopeptide repeat protein [Helicobacteraceae bacterium]|jgi:TPR repeat protein|nr:tetratricopeptide repeat protein [Helicobacteraceae bacterium]
MRIYLITLTLLLLLAGCGASPDAALSPKLSHYATAQQQCSNFIDGKSKLTGEVEKECEQFLKRLEQANETADELTNKDLMKGEYKQKTIVYARERQRLTLQYDALSEAVKSATLASIKRDNMDAFAQGIAFPGNTFIAPYYDYMKSKAPHFDNNAYYLDYQRKESGELMLKAKQNLDLGRKNEALALFEKAAERNNPQAARSAALLYEEINIELALKWHHRAVDGGVKASYLNLGRLYNEKGQKEAALNWYLKSAAEDNAEAQYQLYNYYLDSDKSTAITWLEKAAANGDNHAQYSYALILLKEGKTDKAVDLLHQASQSGNQQASDRLGEYYYDLNLFKRAFTQLEQSKSANSFYLRAKMLETGTGVEKDLSTAYTFYLQADSLGKDGVEKDLQRVNRLLVKEQQRIAEEEDRVRIEKMKKLVKECGLIPTRVNIKKKNVKLHIIGTASVPVGRQSFIIYGDNGEDYYLQRAKGIQENDRVDIVVMSTGLTATVSIADDEESREIYQFTFLKACVVEE